MKFLVLTLVMVSAAFAQDRSMLEERALDMAQKVERLTRENVRDLTQEELRDLLESFRKSLQVLRQTDVGPGPRPHPRPHPRPWPRPRPVVVCENDSADALQAAFKVIKDWAYSSAGLDMSSSGALDYAKEWTAKYPCEIANQYVADFKLLKDFAYASSGLDMSSSGAMSYAKEKIGSFCSGYDLASEFKKHYDFAYSSTGLDMSSSGARKYATEKIEAAAFSCHNF